jgi:AraC-like DNA-binding protein
LELHPAVAYAVQQFQRAAEGSKVSEVCGRIGLSSRRLIELFRREVGLTPKVFSRVRRFQHVLETVRLGKRVDWPRVALDCGYYDQAHFIHEFQAFSGLTPSEYVAAATPNINHVRLT